MSWTDYPLPIAAEGAPTLKRWRKLRSGELQNYRDIIVALPPSYQESGRSYPVVVMHDGQNLFDPVASFAGDWGLVGQLADLARRQVEAVVVGIANTGPFRQYEYSPFRDPVHGGGDGDRYLEFIIGAVLPLVRRSFRVLDQPGATSIAGSSMGGLVSLYALLKWPQHFGAAAAMSPSAWFAGEALRRVVEASPPPAGRLWLDIGTGEGDRTLQSVRRLRDALIAQGLPVGERLHYVEDPGATHQEQDWGRRFADVMPFLLG
ncbi:MAG TPA: alpha/beta hydrolase-fold protein [Gemmatimonadales bacterium]